MGYTNPYETNNQIINPDLQGSSAKGCLPTMNIFHMLVLERVRDDGKGKGLGEITSKLVLSAELSFK